MKDLDLPPERDLPERWMQSREELLRQVIRNERPTRRPWRRWAWRGNLAVVGMTTGLLVTGGVATAYLTAKPADERNSVRCYTTAEVGDGNAFKGTTLARLTPGGGPPADIADDAVAQCASLWRQGFLTLDAKGIQHPSDGTEHKVPSLAACVLESGSAAVFPGDPATTCAELGLPQLARKHA